MSDEQFKNTEIIKQITVFWIVQVQGFWVNKLKIQALAENAFSAKRIIKWFTESKFLILRKIPISVFLQNGNGVLPFIQQALYQQALYQ